MNPSPQEQPTSPQAGALAEPLQQGTSRKPAHARIVLDASGGDGPLRNRLAGAVEAARLYGDVTVLLCGALEEMERGLTDLGACPENIELIDAPDRIGMHEPPVQALREKKNSSIVVGVEMVARGEADAFVSAGNTGAVAAASSLKLGRLKGVQRPGIAVAMEVIDHPVVAIDVGANVHAKATHLLQYGIMADVFARELLGIEKPRVGLLNVGEEDAKGNNLVKQAHELLSKAELNFIGNAEPEKLFGHGCDIVVCDGFVGNILLKVSESLMMRLIEWLRLEVRQSLRYKLGYLLCRDLFGHLKHCGDFSEYGGAPLLGVNGVTIITHGVSNARAIQNAIREARAFVELHVNDHIEEAIQRDAAAKESRA
ncbi:MAG: phosphate acyltransferase PlsX [Planctomycetota bacterium]|jgi:glycerol-3-phosphate acyltransferase PlsX